jgi:hypothetical protein
LKPTIQISGFVMAPKKLNGSHRIVRQVPYSRQIRGDNNEYLGVLYSAFTLRPSETYLSVAWCEYFDLPVDQQARAAISELRAARPDKKSTGYWISEISEIQNKLSPHRIRALHEPIEGFESHAALRRWPEDQELLETLAQDADADFLLSGDLFE